MKKNFITLWYFLSVLVSVAQENLLQSGPMVGYSDFREALIWVQTTAAAKVKIGYFTENETEKFTETIETSKKGDFIAKFKPNEVDYGKTYMYKLYINDVYVPRDYKLEFQTQTLWQWRTDPPNFKMAFGSCSFINEKKDDRPKPYGAKYQIFNSILAKDPDLMVWVGDNMYLREPDFMTETGIRHRFRHTRSVKELQALLGSVHHYATWDDHDYGPNNADRSYVNKKIAEQTFNDYWGNLNTNAAGNGGVTQHFAWNDVEFFMLDDRYHRAPNRDPNKDKAYLGEQQLNWLIDALTKSRAAFKIVVNGGQVISDVAKFENYATYPTELNELLDRIDKAKVEGVIFISGDRHHTEISKMERENAYPLIDITCSPLTAGTHSPRDEGNTRQVKGKTFYNRNFGIIEVTGKRRDRVMLLTIYDSDGNKVFDYEIKAKDLRYPRTKK
jgi:alkaline phosphatase D